MADNLAKFVDPVFSGQYHNGATVLLALYAFAFQIFSDFAGYSNIARGLGKCMGFEIMVNFNCPYFSTKPRDFWRRWHISLSTWFRDYLYIPLGGNRKGRVATYRNLGITMVLAGLWHGANWTFLLWGAYHGALLALHRAMQSLFKGRGFPGAGLWERMWWVVKLVVFFHLICLGWLIFRVQSMPQLAHMVKALFFNFHLEAWAHLAYQVLCVFSVALPVLLMQLFQFKSGEVTVMFRLKWPVKAVAYCLMYYLNHSIRGDRWPGIHLLPVLDASQPRF